MYANLKTELSLYHFLAINFSLFSKLQQLWTSGHSCIYAIIIVYNYGWWPLVENVILYLGSALLLWQNLYLFAITYTTHLQLFLFLLKGFMLFWLLHPGSGVNFIMAILIAIGGAGQEPLLRAYLNDQLKNNSQSLDSTNDKIWWHIPCSLLYIYQNKAMSNITSNL